MFYITFLVCWTNIPDGCHGMLLFETIKLIDYKAPGSQLGNQSLMSVDLPAAAGREL